MRVYYAHCIAIYNTPQERRDVELLEHLGYRVVNPNDNGIEAECDAIRRDWAVMRMNTGGELSIARRAQLAPYSDAGAAVMNEVFKPMVKRQDALAFRALPDGRIPAGVAQEIKWAHEAGLPMFELPSGLRQRVLDVESTREYLREVGQR